MICVSDRNNRHIFLFFSQGLPCSACKRLKFGSIASGVAHGVRLQFALVEFDSEGLVDFTLELVADSFVFVELRVTEETIGVLPANFSELGTVFSLDLLRDDHGLDLFDEVLPTLQTIDAL